MFRPSHTFLRSSRWCSAKALTPRPTLRAFSGTALRCNEPKPGQFARTDPNITVKDRDTPSSSEPVRGVKRTLGSFSMEGKVAVVTGGASGYRESSWSTAVVAGLQLRALSDRERHVNGAGADMCSLGYVMTQALVESGADAAIVDLNYEGAVKAAASLSKHFRDRNPNAEHLPTITAHSADVSNPSSVRDTIAEVLRTHNHIDALVTSAGFTENFKAEDYPYDRMQKLWGVNVNGTYLCAVEIAKHMIERKSGGSMVFIGSMSGSIVNIPQPQAPYNASKAAVRHLASSMAVEWATHGIRVNCISPGYMLTALTEKILEERPDLKAKWTSLIPQGRMGNPEDLMGAVVFLASDASLYVNGADLRVDGGYTVT